MYDEKKNEYIRYTIGSNIQTERRKRGLTQEMLAEKMGVSFQAVSSWERGEYLPETIKFVELSEKLEVPAGRLIRERTENSPREMSFDWQNMYTFLKSQAKSYGLENVLNALPFARNVHERQFRKGERRVPYIIHPLTMACHALAMGIKDDVILSACILHDVLEDGRKENGSRYSAEELPVNEETKRIVSLLSHEDTGRENRERVMKENLQRLSSEPKAVLVKCLDRCNNISEMAMGMTPEKVLAYLEETEKYVLPLLDILKETPEYNDAAWLLKYHMYSVLNTIAALL